MKFVQKLLMGIGGLAAAGVLLTLVSPKAHAIAAALVEVTNTRSAPVPNQDVDAPARHPFALVCRFLTSSVGCNPPPVPANTEFVIQTVDIIGETGLAGTPWPLSFGIVETLAGGQVTTINIGFPVVNSGGMFGTATQSLTAYADPGVTLFCGITSPIALPSGDVTCTIVGYTVSLP
jgi:hypothetical protein